VLARNRALLIAKLYTKKAASKLMTKVLHKIDWS